MRPFLLENPPNAFLPRQPANEKQFEEQVVRVAHQLMPSFMVSTWKPLIRDQYGKGAKPDLAMISNDVESWYVVEVELATHSVAGHIAPQLETLSNGVYDGSLIRSLKNSFPYEDINSLRRLVNRQPGLLCIVDQYTDMIGRTCRYTGFDLVVLEPYYGDQGGWAVLADKIPSELSKTVRPGTFSLSHGEKFGEDHVRMLLPMDFPASFFKIRSAGRPGCDGERSFHVTRQSDGRPSVIVPIDFVPENYTARVEVVGISEKTLELVVEEEHVN